MGHGIDILTQPGTLRTSRQCLYFLIALFLVVVPWSHAKELAPASGTSSPTSRPRSRFCRNGRWRLGRGFPSQGSSPWPWPVSRLHSVSCTCSLVPAGQSPDMNSKHIHWSTNISYWLRFHSLFCQLLTFAGAVTCASRRRRRRRRWILSAVSANRFDKHFSKIGGALC